MGISSVPSEPLPVSAAASVLQSPPVPAAASVLQSSPVSAAASVLQPQPIRAPHAPSPGRLLFLLPCLCPGRSQFPLLRLRPVTLPLSMTRIRSAWSTVLIRWAMVSMVQSLKASWMVFWIKDKAKPFKDGLMMSLLSTTKRATNKVKVEAMESRQKESQRVPE
ncbi:hypothetical protein EYF80_048183 [Liparis tanakae]|uniref:Uncharacterized protein n=1 Tax=Liparis tanakae TaxID=230148 RepID=A0A4Z2FKJ4_9TELE|nr:hypothetical protein EYF80_048183 [Liparis tanakae]